MRASPGSRKRCLGGSWLAGIVILLISSVFIDHQASPASASEPGASDYSFPTPTKGELARRIAMFTSQEYIPDGGKTDKIYQYRLFVPGALKKSVITADPKEREYPLLVWLHGYGESGTDNWRHLRYIKDEVARWEEAREGFPAFVLALQSPYEGHWDSDVQDLLMRLIEYTIDDWPVDEERVYLAGVSSGGDGTWQFAANYPDVFAAAAPMASTVATIPAARLPKVPIWAFQVAKDPIASPEPIRRTVAAIQGNGGSCWLTETAGKTHDCWTAAFIDYRVADWLLSQRRNHSVVAVPGWVSWKAFAVAI